MFDDLPMSRVHDGPFGDHSVDLTRGLRCPFISTAVICCAFVSSAATTTCTFVGFTEAYRNLQPGAS